MGTIQSSRGFFYKRISITNDVFPSAPSIKFPFQATRVLIAFRNIKANEILTFSFKKPDVDGEFFPEDTPLAMDGLSEGRLWFKTNNTQNPDGEIRVWAWRGGGT